MKRPMLHRWSQECTIERRKTSTAYRHIKSNLNPTKASRYKRRQVIRVKHSAELNHHLGEHMSQNYKQKHPFHSSVLRSVSLRPNLPAIPSDFISLEFAIYKFWNRDYLRKILFVNRNSRVLVFKFFHFKVWFCLCRLHWLCFPFFCSVSEKIFHRSAFQVEME